jgi:NAD(P) transhydrogenase subunit alpha
MYSRNISTFLAHLLRTGSLVVDDSDEITRETLIAYQGEVVHPRVRQALGLPQIAAETAARPTR